MKGIGNLVRMNRLPVNLLKQTLTRDLKSSSHVVSVVRLVDLVVLSLPVTGLQLYLLSDTIGLRGISLLDYYFADIFVVEHLVDYYWHEFYSNLCKVIGTSSLFIRSTGGVIFSMSCFIPNMNSSCCLREAYTPITSPCVSSMPMYMVPPFEFRKLVTVFSKINFSLLDYIGNR